MQLTTSRNFFQNATALLYDLFLASKQQLGPRKGPLGHSLSGKEAKAQLGVPEGSLPFNVLKMIEVLLNIMRKNVNL